MNKIVKVSILLLLLVVITSNVNAEDIIFRGIKFGSSKQEVENEEGAQYLTGNDDTLFFSDTLFGEDVIVAYRFMDNQLYDGAYLFQMKPSNPNVYVVTYGKIKVQLINKYGAPKEDKENWLPNPTFENDLGWAIKTGELQLNTVWEFDNGNIKMVLGNNDGIVFAITYQSNKY